ncbi:MAG: hypothetical protein MUF29_03800 [Chitinophagaceae bacterium]|nr:hypothetical protein [Chitinophagaceae bacterium]
MLSAAEISGQKKDSMVSWVVGGTLPPAPGASEAPGVAGPVCGASGNKMFVAGGANFPDAMPWQGGQKKYHDQVYVFSRSGDRLHLISAAGRLPEPIAYAASCSTPMGVLYAGGENEAGISDRVYLIRWDQEMQATKIDPMPALPVSLTNAAAAALGHVVFVTGGEGRSGVSDKGWKLDLQNLAAGWQPLVALPKPVSHAVLVAVSDDDGPRLLLLGGRRKTAAGISELYADVFVMHAKRNQWKALPELPYPLSAATGVACGTDKVYLFGGDRGTTFSRVERYLVDIAQTTDATQKEKLIREKNELLAAHPGFNKEVLVYHTATGTSTMAGNMPFPPPVTTTAFWWDNKVIIPSGEIRAGVRTPQILMATLSPVQQ